MERKIAGTYALGNRISAVLPSASRDDPWMSSSNWNAEPQSLLRAGFEQRNLFQLCDIWLLVGTECGRQGRLQCLPQFWLFHQVVDGRG